MTVAANVLITPGGKDQPVYVGGNFVASCTTDGTAIQRVMWTGPDNDQITDYRARLDLKDYFHIHKF